MSTGRFHMKCHAQPYSSKRTDWLPVGILVALLTSFISLSACVIMIGEIPVSAPGKGAKSSLQLELPVVGTQQGDCTNDMKSKDAANGSL